MAEQGLLEWGQGRHLEVLTGVLCGRYKELGLFPAVSNTLLSKAKKNDNQIMVRTIWGEQQS